MDIPMGKKTKTACCGGGGGGDDHDLTFLFPKEYLIQILVRLPVISLLRFKCVCKSWLALIQSSFFMDLHNTFATTSNSSSSSKFGTFIIKALQCHEGSLRRISAFHLLSSESVSESKSKSEESEYVDWYRGADGTWHKLTEESEYGDWYWGADGTWHKLTVSGEGGDWHWDITTSSWYWVPDDEADNDNDDDDDDQLVLKLDYLGQPPIPSLDMLRYNDIPAGSCNGLICLFDSYHKAVSLWNPATRQFRRLPKSITMEKLSDLVLFGFDVETKDYKVLRVTYSPKRCGKQLEEFSCRAQVYSLSTDSWRLLEGINSLPGVPFDGRFGLYLNNGTCYFMATATPTYRGNQNNRFIISYNFTKEIFTTIQFPDHDNSRHLYLCCLGGEKIALFTTLPNTTSSSSPSSEWWEDYDGSQDCDIWVLNEHDGGGVNKESWNKLHSFQINNEIVYGLTILKGISNDGKFALLATDHSDGFRRRKMLLYNLVTNEAVMDFLICERLSEVYVFEPSLVSIIGGNGAAAAAPSMFGEAPPSASGFFENQTSQPNNNKSKGTVIEEIVSHDDEEEGKGQKKVNPRKHSRSEVPDVEAEERKNKTLQYRKNQYNWEDIIQLECHASSTTRRMGNDGVVVEESKEADTTTGKATHTLSRGILDKGHSVTRNLNPDGKVDTMQPPPRV